VSYAHEDRKLFDRFHRLLVPRLANDKHLDFSLWWDGEILVGDRWEERIREAIASADFSLLLVSPDYLSRRFIARVEVPAILVDPAMLVMPVGLQVVDFPRSDLQGLEAHQIFRLQIRGETELRFFAELNGPNPARFCNALAAQISVRCRGRGGPP
jgi:hypothetical protein